MFDVVVLCELMSDFVVIGCVVLRRGAACGAACGCC